MRLLLFCLSLFSSSLLLAQEVAPPTALPLWPASQTAGTPSRQEHDTTTDKDRLVAGKRVQRLTGVVNPIITPYPGAPANNTRTAIVVFPGGGYRILAYDLEGTEVCDWLHSIGVTCVLLKYRVPDAGPYPAHSEDLADAQRAVRLTREHAAQWNVDVNRVGVLGFSAGGHLAAVLSNHAAERVYPPADAADQLSARPDFALLIYPGGLRHPPDLTKLGQEVTPGPGTPPTFLVQAEDDPVHVENTLLYYQALKQANVPADMHVFARGGHGYGLRRTDLPITDWPVLAAQWLKSIGMLQ